MVLGIISQRTSSVTLRIVVMDLCCHCLTSSTDGARRSDALRSSGTFKFAAAGVSITLRAGPIACAPRAGRETGVASGLEVGANDEPDAPSAVEDCAEYDGMVCMGCVCGGKTVYPSRAVGAGVLEV